MIDEWKNPLKDPFFFIKLDHIVSYKPSDYCSNQGCTLFVLAYDFFFLFLISIFYDFFLLYCPNLFPIELNYLFLVQIPSISSSEGVEGVGACLCTWYGLIHNNMSVCVYRDLSFMLLFRDNFFNRPLLYPLHPAYRWDRLLSRKHLQVAGDP